MLPIIGLISVEMFLPFDSFTHRPWEALLFRSNKTMYFYPNQSLSNQSVGDLCHHTSFAIKKNEHWITDALGYRNNSLIKNPEVLIIGDSFIVGSSITQDSTITNVLKDKLNRSVYNIAPVGFQDFIELLNQGVIEKPKIIIFSLNERGIPSPIKLTETKRILANKTTSSILFDKVKRLYSLKYINSRLRGKKGQGIKGKVDSSMFFLSVKEPNYSYSKIKNVTKTIESYKDYCESIGIDFIFLPLPNKETVYFDKIPLKTQPCYLLKLDIVLRKRKIKTINTTEVFKNYRKSNSKLLYHLDDSHWNARGVKLISKIILEFINKDVVQKAAVSG